MLEHDYATLKYNATQHWRECVCGAEQNIALHNGGEATCIAQAICQDCNQRYGEIDEDNHHYTPRVIEPTKTEGGYTVHTCECGDFYKDSYTDATGSLGLEYSLNADGNSYTVTKIGTCEDTEIIIPKRHQNKDVTGVGARAFLDCEHITSVVIGENITSIGEYAFANCSSLTDIYYNAIECADIDGKADIFLNAGQGGEGITLTVGANVKRIPAYLFHTYSDEGKLVEISFEEGSVCESIGKYAFSPCSYLERVELADSIKTIGRYSFYNCTNLQYLVIGKGVVSIEGSAFKDCWGLEEIYYNATECSDLVGDSTSAVFMKVGKNTSGLTIIIGANVKKIPAYLFGNSYSFDEKITEVVFEEGSVCESIGKRAFYYSSTLNNVHIPNSVTSIGDEAFAYCNTLTSFAIPDSVTSIGQGLLQGCGKLKSVSIGNGVKNMGANILYMCYALTEIQYNATECTDFTSGSSIFGTLGRDYGVTVTIGKNVKRIPAWLFCVNSASYNKIEKVVFEKGSLCETIGKSAFYGCVNLKEIELGEAINSIENDAFLGCENLFSLTIPASVTKIGASAFSSCYRLVEVVNQSAHITLTKGSWEHGEVARFALVVYNQGDTFTGTKVCLDGDYVVYTDGNEKIFVGYLGTETELVLPSYITTVNQYACYDNKNLTSVTLPDGVNSIGGHAFENCSKLTSVTLPDSITSIASSVFQYTSYYNDTNNWENGVLYIGNHLIDTKSTVSDIYAIQEGTVCVANQAFFSCSDLIELIIPNSIQSIGMQAFSTCYNLARVYYRGTNSDWEKIMIGDYNHILTRATRYYYTENPPALNADGTAYEGNFWHYDTDGITPVIWVYTKPEE